MRPRAGPAKRIQEIFEYSEGQAAPRREIRDLFIIRKGVPEAPEGAGKARCFHSRRDYGKMRGLMRSASILNHVLGPVFAACAAGRLPGGGFHARAAARALAVMHVNSAMGVVCAAPTGVSAGALPGSVVTFVEDHGRGKEDAALMPFAAEVAGCRVEIGAAGAMAAAAISSQNTMGSVCDLVQGMVEIPCHRRNAVAASSAFVCADPFLGGYRNSIPPDETIDAVHSVGKMLPAELRCTVKGGIALAPSAVRLTRRGNAFGEARP